MYIIKQTTKVLKKRSIYNDDYESITEVYIGVFATYKDAGDFMEKHKIYETDYELLFLNDKDNYK
jgi:hypothetical protein